MTMNRRTLIALAGWTQAVTDLLQDAVFDSTLAEPFAELQQALKQELLDPEDELKTVFDRNIKTVLIDKNSPRFESGEKL